MQQQSARLENQKHLAIEQEFPVSLITRTLKKQVIPVKKLAKKSHI